MTIIPVMSEPENLVFEAAQNEQVLNLIPDCAYCYVFLELLSDQKGLILGFRALKQIPTLRVKKQISRFYQLHCISTS